jgi:prevent-host-death family protein
MKVGTKELKNRLSHYLRTVRRGETVHVTDRGHIVAELRPVRRPRSRDDAALLELAAEGLVTLGSGRLADIKPLRLKRGVLASRMIIEDRG